ncbi:MAG TPA: alkaline phosphatase D family protein, partial [Methylomirabilota bacterium]|nr:alkaline phosphatase D family protein [Methylomirabilota bacterium]
MLLLGAVPTGLGPAAPPAVDVPAGLLVTVGEVTADAARLWLRVETADAVRVSYGPAAGGETVRTVRVRPAPAADFTARVALEPLAPGTRYAYEVTTATERVQGTFATAPPPTAETPAHLLWSGDLGGAGNCRDVEDGYRIFRAMTRRAADLFLFVGDTIYADQTCGTAPHVAGADYVAGSLADFHGKHRYNRADPAVQEFLRTTPVFAIWDDHEVRNNFAGPVETLMPAGRRAFLDYFPVAGAPDEPERLYRAFRWGRHVEVFILDTRQYRSANVAADGPGKTMLGEAQRRWLLAGLAASEATWKLVVSTVPLGMFTGGPFSDSWSAANLLGAPRPGGAGFVHERTLILDALRRQGVRNVVFLSGDVHHAELIRHEPSPGFVVH